MAGNTTGLYSSSGSGNTTIPANNNTGLYNATGSPIPTSGNINTNNINATGNVTVGGFITANGSITTNANFVGNLVGNVTGNVTIVGNNNSVIYVEENITATSNNFTFDPLSNLLTVQGNINSNYFIGNGSQLTGLPASYSNANVANFLPVYNGNINATTVFGQGLGTQGYDYVQMQYSNSVALPVSQYDIGTGSWFYLDAGGATWQSNTTGTLQAVILGNDGSVSATGNISGNYILGNGSQLTGLPATYGNANVADFLPTYSGNLTANIISTTGNIVSAANLVTSGAGGNIVGANYVSANFYLGNGSQLTGITASYSNSNVATFLAAFGSNTISTTGNVSTGNIIVADDRVIYASHGYYGPPDATFAPVRIGLYGPNPDYAIGVESNYSWIQGQNGVKLYDSSGVTLVANAGGITGANILTGGVVSATGNVTGNYFIGNGSQLTGLPATYGNANVAAYLPTYTGNLSAGNISVGDPGSIVVGGINLSGNLIVGQGPTLTIDPNGAGGTDGNVVITGNLIVNGTTTTINSNTITTNDLQINMANNAANATAANNGGIGVGPIGSEYATLLYNTASNVWVASLGISSVGNITANLGLTTPGNVNSGNVLTAGYVSAAGNVTGANILTGGRVSATGNVTGSYIFGNGSQLTGVVSNYGNSNVSSFLAAFGSNVISTTGNVTANYYIGNGSLLSSLTGANVTGTVANATYAISSGSATTAGTVTTAAQGNITSVGTLTSVSVSGNTTSGNILTSGLVSATGNVTGSYIFGNGSQLTGVVSNYGNSNVNTLLAAWGSNTISTTGTIASGNVTAGNILTSGLVSATGNVTGAYHIGNGSLLTSLTGANVTGTVANATYAVSSGTATSATTAGTVTTAAQPNITSVGTLTVLSSSGNITGANILTAGYVSATGNVTGSYIFGNGSQLTGIAGTYGNTDVAAYLPIYSGNLQSVSGNIATAIATANITVGPSAGNTIIAGNVLINGGYLRTAATTGYLYNITATTLNIGGAANTINIGNTGGNILARGNISASGNVIGTYILGDGSQLTNLPAGSYSNSNVSNFLAAFGSNTISTTGTITSGNATASNFFTAGVVSATGNITGGAYRGNGAPLTGINSFGNIVVAGQSTVASGTTSGSLTLVAGTNITLTTDAPNNKITITSTATAAGDSLSPFLLMGA
jgi:hypothetical protein